MDQHMKRFLCLLIGLTTVCSTSLAQNRSSDSTSLRPGAWALQFAISSNFTLTSFQGTTFSIKYQLSDKNAIRGGISIGGGNSDVTGSTSGIYADTSLGSLPANSSSSSRSGSLNLQYLWYLDPRGPVHAFAGLGPTVSYSYAQSSAGNSYPYNGYWYLTSSSSNSTQWAAGATGSVGVEWFPGEWFSLRAEYGESLQYQWRSNSSTESTSYTNGHGPGYYSGTSTTTKGWSLSNSAVSLGLSVYW